MMVCLQRSCLTLALMAVVFLNSGCGSGTPAKKMSGAVSGTVTFDGQSVSEGSVQLYAPKTGDVAVAPLDASGKFSLPNPIPLGEYNVTVLPPPEPAPQVGVPYVPKEYKKIPKKYRADGTSPFKAEIKPEPNVLTLQMTP